MTLTEIDQLGLSRWKNHPVMSNPEAKDRLVFASVADPTEDKTYFLWLISIYDPAIDTEQLKTALKYFHGLKLRLSKRDIFEYTAQELLSMVHDILNPTLVHIDSDDCTILYDGPIGTLTIPKTLSCIEKLGGGTPWCISRKRNNEFHLYNHSLYTELP
mgnify:CR=1 FL=1